MKIFNAILGVYAVFNSLYCIFWPEETVLGVGWIIAIFLLLWGVSSIAEYFFSRRKVKELKTEGSAGLCFGIIAVIISILSMSSVVLYGVFTIVVALCLAVGFLVKGIIELVDSRKQEKNGWDTFVAVFHLLAGFFGVTSLVFMSENIPVAVGVMMLIIGVAEFGSVFGNDPTQEQSDIW